MDFAPLLNGQAEHSGQTPLTLAILHCGKMGSAILQGLVSASLRQCGDLIDDLDNRAPTSSTSAAQAVQSARISHIFVIARRSEKISGIRGDVQAMLDRPDTNQVGTTIVDQQRRHKPPLSVEVAKATPDNTSHAARAADVIFLCCKPHMFQDVLCDPSLKEAITTGPKPKVLISVLGGVSTLDLESCLGLAPITNRISSKSRLPLCTVVRIIPNLAARIHQSMTVVAAPRGALEKDAVDLVTRICSSLGAVKQLPERQFNIASALASSAIAFHVRLIASAARGVDLMSPASEGGDHLSQADALWIAAHAARGASGLILDGEHPDDIVNQVATRGGSTEIGLQIMQSNHVEDGLTSAVFGCAQKTSQLGTKRSP